MSRAAALLGALVIVVAPAAARSEPAPRPLRYDLRLDLEIAAGAWAAWGASELAKKSLAPSACRVCATNRLDSGARDLLVWDDPDRARRGSNVVAALVPVGVIAHQLLAGRAAGDATAGVVDLLLVVEATGLAMDLTQLAKFTLGRQRPSVRYGNPGPERATDPDDNLSFYSAHTAFAFSLVAAAGTVSTLRGYRSAPWVWGVGMSLAALAAYLRVGADEHHLTDVLTGAAIGTAVGVAVPRLLHPRENGATERSAVVAFPLGVRVVF